MADKLKHKHERGVMIAVYAIAALGLLGGGLLYYRAVNGIISNTTALEEEVLGLREENLGLAGALEAEQKKNAEFSAQISEIAGTVGRLDKLSKTDKELLQKYSRVYFLNENYIPDNLSNVPSDYVYENDRQLQIHAKVFPYLQEMFNAAEKSGVNLKVISAYRSFGEQSALKSSYSVIYGSGANKFSADQGFSEHQLGTTVDLTTEELGAAFTSFGKTDAYKWLLQNAYRYGFILSYPEGNSYYQYEPWHWRFVGKALAERLYEEKQHFYDLDQRKIDAYLIKIFD